MKPLTTIIVAALVGILAAYGTVKITNPTSFEQTSQQTESAYDRIMRTQTIRCGYGIWPPFFDVDPNTGEVIGFNREVMDTIANLLELKVEYVPMVVGSQVQDLESGKYDVACGDGPWILSTIKYLDYTKPYAYSPIYVYRRIGGKTFTSLNELNNESVTFAGMDGDVSTDLVLRNYPKAQIHSLSNMADPAQILTDLATGKADVVIIDPQSAQKFMESNPDKITLLFKEPLAIYGSAFSMRKGENKLFNMMQEATNAALNMGMIDAILKRYDPQGAMFLPTDESYDDVR